MSEQQVLIHNLIKSLSENLDTAMGLLVDIKKYLNIEDTKCLSDDVICDNLEKASKEL